MSSRLMKIIITINITCISEKSDFLCKFKVKNTNCVLSYKVALDY